MSIHVGNPSEFSTVRAAVPDIPHSELNRPAVSTIPMLSFMVHAEAQFFDLIRELGMKQYDELILEYKAGPFGGKGQASHTDVMLLNKNQALAIEAKWTEGMYPTVSKWRDSGKVRKNRNEVLKGWFSKLVDNPESMVADEYGHLIYQMVHRAASAASTGKQHPSMAYFLFRLGEKSKGATPARIKKKLEVLWSVLPEPFPCYVVELPMKATAEYGKIADLKKRSDETAMRVSEVLQGEKALFKFANPVITRIGEGS